MLSLLLPLVLLGAVLSPATSALDASDVVFASGLGTGSLSVCTQNYPVNVSFVDVLSRTVVIQWEPPANESDIVGYEVLYRIASTSLYQRLRLNDLVYTVTLNDLTGLSNYYVTVRGICEGEETYGPAPDEIIFQTLSRAPEVAPVIISNSTPVDGDHTKYKFCWMRINDSHWNGIDITYIFNLFDVTPDFDGMIEHRLNASVPNTTFCIIVSNLTDMHYYLMIVSASSSGGIGPFSIPLRIFVEIPLPPPSPVIHSPATWQFYLTIIPSLILFAIVVGVILLCFKLCYSKKKGNVTHVRDINKNIEDGRLFVTSRSFRTADRFELQRLSNRPLPPNPAQTPTPSAMSVNARLIAKDYSPPTPATVGHFEYYPEYPQSYPFPHHHHHPSHHHPSHHSHHHHHPLSLDTDPMGRHNSTSVTSPHYPTLSQPLSDMSSVTPTSVFNESSVPPHSDERYPPNRSPVSPSNPNPYEVPNESETGHHSVSPPGHHTLPGTRRPHTAHAESQPAFYPHHHHAHQVQGQRRTPPMTQSSMELFHFQTAPPVPPHRSNSNIVQSSSNMRSASPRIPEEGDYSEIPESPTEEATKISSPVSSDQYNSYSDIPTAISPPLASEVEGRRERPLKSSPGHSSYTDSVSSFSTDSQSASPMRTRHSHPSSYRGSGASDAAMATAKPNGSIPRSNSKSSQSQMTAGADKATPYLSPTSLKTSSSSNSDAATPPSQ